MRPHYILASAPVTEPVSLDQATEHLRVDSEDDTAYIESLIPVAREFVESITGRVCGLSTWRLTADSWASATMGCDYDIPLFRTPLVSVASIKVYLAGDTTQTTLDPSTYIAMTGYQPGVVYFPESLPDLAHRPDALEIEFMAGHQDPESSPPGLRHAIKILISHLYENRLPVAFASCNEIPYTLQGLLSNQKLGGWIG